VSCGVSRMREAGGDADCLIAQNDSGITNKVIVGKMWCTRGLLALSVSVWVVGAAPAFLPQNRFTWWDAIPPPER